MLQADQEYFRNVLGSANTKLLKLREEQDTALIATLLVQAQEHTVLCGF